MFAMKECIDSRKKNLLNSNISSTRLHNMENFSPLAAEIGLVVWGTPANFNGFCVLVSILQRYRSPDANQTLQCLAISWAGTLYMHFRGLLPPDGILPVQYSLYVQVLHSPVIGSVTARQFNSGHQRNFAAWYKEWNYGTFAEGVIYIWLGGHRVWHWPTF